MELALEAGAVLAEGPRWDARIERLLWVDIHGKALHRFDPASGEVKRREKFSNPYHMEYSPDGRFLVVTSLRRDQVDIYDAATRTLLARLRVLA